MAQDGAERGVRHPAGGGTARSGPARARQGQTESDPKNYVASVEKAVRLLELFDEGEPVLSLPTIVARSGYTRTTAYRLLSTLERVGWLSRSGAGYHLTLRVFRLGASAGNALKLREIAAEVLVDLAARGGETAYLIVPDGLRGVCLERVEGPSLVRVMVLDVGKSLPLHVGGGPTALLAHRDDLLEEVFASGPLQTMTGAPLTPDELRDTLRGIRERGYSRSAEDVTASVGAFGAPVFDAQGTAIAAVSVGGMLKTLTEKESKLSAALCDAAASISARLGHRPGT
ncbi:IclR family transcriptional regulator [Rhodovulum sp. 12E13]|uniref:IclR family transcriptional regulator n=1 Tax=Rhodovulum sp. 12E13 TaxID=2203891 RepID=UPI000E166BF8|nr:IclR family transcriptional regulator [Rhodovulum sp. 12E13]RDC71244.1 IclR family transcriptional regulator [Rhodovulum sp. 12E13]